MSRARRLMLTAALSVAAVLLAVGAGAVFLRDSPVLVSTGGQDVQGPVLLVPGYGGSTGALAVLARRLEQEGRRTELVRLPGDGRGSLEESARRLAAAADAAMAAGAPSVDVVGYSAGGVVARLWARSGGAYQARRIVTLGSPHHGTELAALGAGLTTGSCPAACQELVPGSALLETLNAEDETPTGPAWLTLWTRDDEVVTPPDSARLEGAEQVELQRLCPDARVSHGQLPTDPAAQAVVLAALSTGPMTPPGPEVCGG